MLLLLLLFLELLVQDVTWRFLYRGLRPVVLAQLALGHFDLVHLLLKSQLLLSGPISLNRFLSLAPLLGLI